ncbi:MAG: hypothetical protein GC154_18945 [bacterium]|nr:hypothetical protein [bacterium]
MKRFTQIGIGVLLSACICAGSMTGWAQQGGQRGGGFRGQSAQLLCDALLLSPAASEKVEAAYDAAREKAMANRGDMSNMSREERMEAFQKSQEEIAASLKTDLKDVLPESDLGEIEGVLAVRTFMPVVEVRGLRMVELTKEQHDALQPLSLAAVKAIPPMRFGQDPDADAAAKFDEAKGKLVAKANEMLTADQKKSWEEKQAEVQKEIDDMRARMQQRRNGGQ